ncbi:hypothetical protein Tco_0986108 [Tanacetum coccineum]
MSKTPPTKGKRLKTFVKAAKTTKKKQPAKTSKAKGVDEGTGSIQDDDDEQTKSDNYGDDFVHPKLSTHDDEARQDDVVNEEESDDESNEDSDEEVQGTIIEEKEMDEEAPHEEDEANELYRDVNINLEGRNNVMTDAPLPNVQRTQVTEDTHVIITAPINPEGQQQSSSVSSGFVSNMLNPSPDTSIDTIFTPNTEATSLVDVPITTIAEPPLFSATTLPPTPLITHLQQTPVPTPTTILRSSLHDLLNFGSLFGFDHRLKTLETDFSEFKQINQFAEAVSSIPDIVDAYLANKMHESVKTAIQLQSERLKDEAQAKNAEFLNKLDDNIKKIIKDQVKEEVKAQVSKILLKIKKTVNEQLEAEVMTRSSTESKTSLDIAANLSELELKKILIDKMERNKRRDDEDKYEEPSAGSNWGSKRRRAGKEPESTSAPKEKTSKTSGKSYEGSKSKHKTEFETGVTKNQPNEETPQFPDWFQRPRKLPSPDHDWNKTLPDAHGHVDTLTPELLTGLTFELMKGSCKSLVELEYLFEEVYKATTRTTLKESARDVYSKLRIIAVTKLEIIDWHNYKYLDWITVRRDDDKLYKFKEGDFNRLRIQDIEDMITVRRDDDKLYKFKEGDFNRLRIQDIKDILLFLVQG